MHEPRNFQELLLQRQERAFVGRTKERAIFRANIELPETDSRKRFVVAVSGQAGMGKSSFMGQCREIAVDTGFATTWVDETLVTHDLVQLLDIMASDLGSPAQFAAFNDALESYRENRHQLETHAEAPEDIARVIAASTGRIGTKLARGIPEVGEVFELIDENAAGDQLGQVATFIFRQVRHREDALLLLEPIETLTPLFLQGLEVVAADRPIGLFFDTFEETSPTLEPWLLQLLKGEFGSVPLSLLIAVAGQRPLDPNVWSSVEPVIQRIILEPLSDEESEEFLTQKGVQDPEQMKRLMRVAKGIPIQLVSIAANTKDDPEASETLVDRVLGSVQEDLRAVAVLAAIPRILNRDIADNLFDEKAPQDAFDQLRSMPFVQSGSNGWKYHSVIRAELLRYGLKETPDKWANSHQVLADYFVTVRKRFTSSGDYERAYQADAEHVYHAMCAGTAGATGKGLRRCIRAFGVDPGLSRRWATVMRDAERDLEKDWTSGWGESWLEVLNEYGKDHEAPALSLLTRILHAGELPTAGKAELLEVRSDIYREQSRLDAALKDIEGALALRPDDRDLIYKRALVYLDQREFEKAMEGCAEAVAGTATDDPKFLTYRVMQVRMSLQVQEPTTSLELIDDLLKEAPHPWAFLTRGQILRRLKKPEDAVSNFEKVLELSPGNAHEAWKEIALCHAEADDNPKAEAALERALEEQPRCTHCWEALAALYVRDEKLDAGAKKLIETCQVTDDLGIKAYRARGLMQLGHADIAIKELKAALGDDPSSPDYHLWLARAQAAERQIDDSLAEVEEALRLRPEWPDALAFRGNLFFALGDHSRADQDWSLAEDIDPRSDYWIQSGDRGLTLSVLGEYEKAIRLLDEAMKEGVRPDAVYNRTIAQVRLKGVEESKGEISRAEEVLQEATLPVVSIYGLAGLKAVSGNQEDALARLSDAVAADREKAVHWAKSDPAWNGLRSNPEFQRILDEDSREPLS